MKKKADATTGEQFKCCTCCSVTWRTRDEFLTDPDVELIGYQANFEDLKTGMLLFNHACHATMATEAEIFRDLYDGPVFRERATGGPTCPEYCLHRDDLRPCQARCECAYVREILQVVCHWKKRKVA